MSNTEVTKAPALTPAQRQANRRARIQEHAERGAQALYQVRSFETLLQCAADLGIGWAQAAAALTPQGTLQELNEVLNMEVMRERMIRRNEENEARRKHTEKVSHEAAPSPAEPAPAKTRAKRKTSVTAAPSKGIAKTRRVRERVGK